MTSPILEEWSFCAPQDEMKLVFPDGCRDVIFLRSPGGPWNWFCTELDDHARPVRLGSGSEFHGFRMRPGVTLDQDQLRRALASLSPTNIEISDIEECCSFSFQSLEILEALATSPSLSAAAQQTGTSVRTLQRYTTQLTTRAPLYWLRLARARQAAAGIEAGSPFVVAAADHGFADQAHMTREFRHWFSLTPGQVQARVPLTVGLCESGFGTPSVADCANG